MRALLSGPAAALPPVRWLVLAVLAALAVGLTLRSLAALAPLGEWGAIAAGRQGGVQALILAHVALPRVTMSIVMGAALGLAGLLLQQALRNPLADPATLGVSSGAYLAMAGAALYAPALLDWSPEAVALGGGVLACLLVMAVARGSQFSTISVILAGLIVSLFCGAAAAALTLMNHEYLSGLFIWQTGSLAQNGWYRVGRALPQLALLAVVAWLLRRPLALLALEDAHAASLGLHVSRVRAAAIAVGVAISAVSVAAVGVIGFIGLMAPNLARMLGARTLRQGMAVAPVVGALLLWLTDQGVQLMERSAGSMPTGSACALVGAPLLLWLLLRQRGALGGRPAAADSVALQRRLAAGPILALCALACVTSVLAGLLLGRGASGWAGVDEIAWVGIWDWRAPRVAAAAVAGAMLALAGTLLQRLTGNPLASPEVLGVSAGASLGVIALLLLTADLGAQGMLAASCVGAMATLAAVVALNWRFGFAPERLLLVGAALSTLFSACAAFLLTSGDPRAAALLTWMSGSTYRVTSASIAPGLLLLVLGYGSALAGQRWLDILPLGRAGAVALGVNVTLARLYFLAIIAVVTASATILVGPLTFVGLLAPHIVRGLGLTRPLPLLAGAVLGGATIMVAADWLGRTVIFPWQIPAGLIAMLAGGPVFLWLLWRNK
ncbi:Fe(3+)-hydroxamate ABC transporter permease FhuB [Achromobacter pulmonis]|uniref:Ferrichrome transport protein FhuB n=2 Tax=Alcaligenaceae TaxID=506 RepID=A9IA90_BORPD|nr:MULTISPECIES: Fe(3+)-hydroxamate ABC transporter permease FhuB [Alcaligenaceae]PND33708.1 Fe(3+)-hydroxamate ABC transporter permease FhuB [Achromobacter pulmonis]CAP44557.1 ferrichrome transport protein FhuB precursor [Bordetella petrii]